MNNNQLINITSKNTKIPRLELEILLSHVLHKDRIYLKAYPEDIVSIKNIVKFNQLLSRRLKGEPIAYIVQNKNFWDLNLFINKNVLIPRTETELLVEKTLELLTVILPLKRKIKILELGTGSGAIALAIAKSYPKEVEIIATDISNQALKIAKLNANRLNITNISFLLGDWFQALKLQNNNKYNINYDHNINKFDIIISNPPYIAKHEMHLCNNEIFFEPEIALFAKHDGLACLNHIVMCSKNYLNTNGSLIIEHGAFQQLEVIKLFINANFNNIKFYKDLLGLNRLVIGN